MGILPGLRCSLRKRHAASGSARELSLVISSIQAEASWIFWFRLTHAWAEIYVPGAGWITFDPTNRSVGGFNLIPVAVARDIAQVVPVAGSFVGMTDAFMGMTVEVGVTG